MKEYIPNLNSFQPKQIEFLRLAEDPSVQTLAAIGGIRAGKDWSCAAVLILRALSMPNTDHAIVQAYKAMARRVAFTSTLRSVFDKILPGYFADVLEQGCRVDSVRGIITLPNGARIVTLGLHDLDEAREFDFKTAWLSDASHEDVAYRDVKRLRKLLSGSSTKMLMSANPTIKDSWVYQTFIDRRVPGKRNPLPDAGSWRWVGMNIADIEALLPEGTIEELFRDTPDYIRERDEHGMW